jgi:quercetin dioxygenase-like cupin family protein
MSKIFYAICLSMLLSCPAWAKDTGIAKVEVLLKTDSSWDGEPLPEYSNGKPEITILRITIPPKSQLPMHMHPVINAGVLIKGKLTVVKEGGELLYLDTGDSIAELVDQWHYGKNEGMEPAEIMVFYAGTLGEPITIKK